MKKYLAELLGTASLLTVIAGSGIMGENLSQGNAAIALLANSLATGAGLFVLIQCLGPISGAHLNPVVSLVEWKWGRLGSKDLLAYWSAQFGGAVLGIWIVHGMFALPLFQTATRSRAEPHLYFSEFIATAGLLVTVALAGKKRVEWAPASIAAYITSAYWFTSSTSFANPAVTFARAWTDTFCGIAPSGVPGFVLAQLLAAGVVSNLRLNSRVDRADS